MIRRFYGDDPWALSWGQWMTRLKTMNALAAAESGQQNHAAESQRLAEQGRIERVRQRALETLDPI
ncbi:MAG: hypothetical protein AAGI37_15450 [Planctomycetota bacterium]